ncbi:MAG: hypothetical protein KAX38_00655, partial [Candidatus Krumholzibacteria bacterium]|nr:hypothetical protein [Candidatus Krumholzibacteria bacterium]
MTESIDRLADILLRPEGKAGVHEEAFGRLGFKDSPKASSLWKNLVGPLELESHAAENAASLIAELAGCPDPDMALLNLCRFADAHISPSHLLDSIFLERPLCHLLVVIFSCSYYLADILVRNPGYLSWLIERDTLESPKHHDLYLKELTDQ